MSSVILLFCRPYNAWLGYWGSTKLVYHQGFLKGQKHNKKYVFFLFDKSMIISPYIYFWFSMTNKLLSFTIFFWYSQNKEKYEFYELKSNSGFFWQKLFLPTWHMTLFVFLVTVLIFPHVHRFSVSRMQDFFMRRISRLKHILL